MSPKVDESEGSVSPKVDTLTGYVGSHLDLIPWEKRFLRKVERTAGILR